MAPRNLNKRTGNLTPVKVRNLAKPGMYSDGRRLYLEIKPGVERPAKSWLFRYRDAAGKGRYLGLGSAYTVGLEEARAKADAESERLESGVDPLLAKRAREAVRSADVAQVMTFRQCAENYITGKELGWRNLKHREQWRSSLATYAYPILGDLPVTAIDTTLVVAVLSPIWNVKTETASRVRSRIERVLSNAKALGLRDGPNPAAWRDHLEHVFASRRKIQKVKHHPALPFAAVPAFMEALRQRRGVTALALRFAVLTACRTEEVLGARWEEFDLAEKVWTIPRERMKGDREHRVPLTQPALDILAEMVADRRSAFVFPGPTAPRLEDGALDGVMRRMRSEFTVHGLRASFRTWGAKKTNFATELLEDALAHLIGNATERSYRHGDFMERRRPLMEAWCAFATKPPASGDVVVPMRVLGAV
jgi:integrase